MLLKKLSTGKHITISYYTDEDTVCTIKGYVYAIKLNGQNVSIKDKERTYTIDLSRIKCID